MGEYSQKKTQIGCNEPRVHLFSVVLIVAFIQIIEFLLLEIKYDLFTGGFLQPYAYLTWGERAAFIGLSLWMDLLLFGGAGAIWYRFRSRLGTRPLVAAYFYVFFCLSAMGVWLNLKYEILSYFNDTINYLIVKNLGGGSISTALYYIANETAVFVISIAALSVLFLIGLKLIRKVACTEFYRRKSRTHFSKSWPAMIVICTTLGVLYFANLSPTLRHGLAKKTSYGLITALLDELTDVDRDGYGVFAFPQDPQPFDADKYPGALDIPGNGIDEDGYGGDFKLEPMIPDPLSEPPFESGSHILLIVLESTRSDLLDKKINGQAATPNISALAKNGSSVDYAYSHTGYTVTSLSALFNRSLATGYGRIKLADHLEKSGYSLSFISGQDESFGKVASRIGMDGAGRYLFDARSALEDRVYPSKDSGSLRLSEDRVVRAFMERSTDVDWNRPQFIYINLQAAHFPYSHPTMPGLVNKQPIPRSEIREANSEWLEATYWNAVSVADDAIGRIIERLRELGVYDQTLVTIVADHGESLFDDHFLGHGHALDEAQTRIPLIFNRPDISIKSAIGQIDMAELIVQLATDRFAEQRWNAPGKPVLQIVGSLNVPQLVGTVSYGEIRTILDLRTRRVFFSDLARWEDFDVAWDDPEMGPRVKDLINLWETTRWQNQLARQEKESQKLPEQVEPL